MPQEESKRGAHFAKGSAPQAPAPEAASFDNEIRNAWSAAADPGETAVYLRAAGADTALPRTVLRLVPMRRRSFWPPLNRAPA
ncbi:MAG: hypothetical protein ACLU0O_13470 [Collinsella sp.]